MNAVSWLPVPGDLATTNGKTMELLRLAPENAAVAEERLLRYLTQVPHIYLTNLVERKAGPRQLRWAKPPKSARPRVHLE